MKMQFIDRKFNRESIQMIETINGILDEYDTQGFTLSLRQLYYQLVARDYVPNNVKSYKHIGDLVSNARQAGLIDWNMIEDRGRDTVKNPHWRDPSEIITIAARQFAIDKWLTQPNHIEIMVEKDALSGVLLPVAQRLDVAITANKGYSSSSTMFEIGRRLHHLSISGKHIVIIYLGDHDPSGIDMTRDVEDRLALYSELDSRDIEVIRVALNYDQVERWNPPENPAKQTDTRFESYALKFGRSSWELDAIEPAELARIVEDLVVSKRDTDRWNDALRKEKRMKNALQRFADTYTESED